MFFFFYKIQRFAYHHVWLVLSFMFFPTTFGKDPFPVDGIYFCKRAHELECVLVENYLIPYASNGHLFACFGTRTQIAQSLNIWEKTNSSSLLVNIQKKQTKKSNQQLVMELGFVWLESVAVSRFMDNEWGDLGEIELRYPMRPIGVATIDMLPCFMELLDFPT